MVQIDAASQGETAVRPVNVKVDEREQRATPIIAADAAM
jgi:hypothetical protein